MQPQPKTSRHEIVTSSFHDYFIPVLATSEEQRRRAYEIRYQVYCQEFGFEDPAEHPDGLERDEYDDQSLHCLLTHQPSGIAAGCVRLVLPKAESPTDPLPFERHCRTSLDRDLVDSILADRSGIGEISRLAVIRQFRRRKSEQESPAGSAASMSFSLVEQRHFPFIAVGLYLSAASTGMLTGLKGVFAMMEPRLARHLSRFGIHFQKVGQLADYHGLRAPFYITRKGLLEGLRPEISNLLKTITSDLKSSIKEDLQIAARKENIKHERSI